MGSVLRCLPFKSDERACLTWCGLTKIGRAIGLIRYSSQEAMETGRRRILRPRVVLYPLLLLALITILPGGAPAAAAPRDPAAEQALLERLDAPLLFVKRHSYTGIHIYDTFYKWPPGGGGIYVLENPAAPRAEWRIRTVIDEVLWNLQGQGW